MTDSGDATGSMTAPVTESTVAAGDHDWLELAVVADLEAVEAVSEILSRFAPGGTSVEPGFELVDEGLAARIDLARPAIVRAYVPARDEAVAAAAVDAARTALGHLQAFGLRPIGELEVRTVREADWADAWKKHFPVLHVGRRLVIRPTWRRHRPAAADVVLALDPGMAFGTGLHPTTRLCLAGLERWADEGRMDTTALPVSGSGAAADSRSAGVRLLDVGCGSGILGIAALKLGAAQVVGLDPDPIAVEATIANARRNGVARRLTAIEGSVPSGRGPFDLVAANLIASLLVQLAGALADELRPGGRILASGIFIDRAPDVRTAFERCGLSVARTEREGDWIVIEAERAA